MHLATVQDVPAKDKSEISTVNVVSGFVMLPKHQDDSSFATPQNPFAIDKVKSRQSLVKLAPPVPQPFSNHALMRSADRIFNTVKVSKVERAASLMTKPIFSISDNR